MRKKATCPVLFHHTRKGIPPEQTHKPVLTSIHPGATGQLVGFHTSVVNVFSSDILNLIAEGEPRKPVDPPLVQSTQLIEHLFKPVIPINPRKLDQLL